MNNHIISEIIAQIELVQRDFTRAEYLAQWAFNKKQELKTTPQYHHLNYLMYIHIIDVLWNINGGAVWNESEDCYNYTDNTIREFKKEFDMALKYLRGEKVYQEILLIQEDLSLDILSKSIVSITNNLLNGNYSIGQNYNFIQEMKDNLIESTRKNIIHLEIIKIIENILYLHNEGQLTINSVGLVNASLSIVSEIEKLKNLELILKGKRPYRLSIAIHQFNIIYANFEVVDN